MDHQTLTSRRLEYVAALEEDLQSLVRQLGGLPEVRTVILFGSYAAGRRDLLTDLDLLVVMESPLDFVTRNAQMAGRLHAGVALDLLVYTPAELEKLRARPFIRHALATGKVLYERASAPREEGQRWLEQAQADLKWARHLNEQGAPYLACFLAQQAAEKALKAVLYASGDEVVVGHSVRQLCQRAAQVDARFAPQADHWSVLDSYYIPTRYPNGLPDDIPARVYDRQAGHSALALAGAVLTAVEDWYRDDAA